MKQQANSDTLLGNIDDLLEMELSEFMGHAREGRKMLDEMIDAEDALDAIPAALPKS